MADTAEQLHYTGETSAVAVKQTAREEPEAHPECARVGSWTGEATMKHVFVHSNYGGVIFDDGNAPVAAMDKTVNQLGTKHHGIVAKLKACSSRAETHRRTLTTVMRTRRRYCRP